MSSDWWRLHRVRGFSSGSPENHWVPWLVPSCLGVTGLTIVSSWWDLSRGIALFVWFYPLVLLVSSWLVWSFCYAL
jgi:hypothetical protein